MFKILERAMNFSRQVYFLGKLTLDMCYMLCNFCLKCFDNPSRNM